MKKPLHVRFLALLLAAGMVLGCVPAVSAAPAGLRWEASDADVSAALTDRVRTVPAEDGLHAATDTVRVSIVLDKKSTLQAGFSTIAIGENAAARSYNAELQADQQALAAVISTKALDGTKLDVVWNLTLAGNLISANVPYGRIEAIEAVAGVKKVVIERQYAPMETAEPQMSGASAMSGAVTLWTGGYTGAGARVAVIDTGTDIDHQSFDNDAFLYALDQSGAEDLDLLDAEEIAAVLDQLNVTDRVGAAAADYYISEKLPFGANYVDYSLDVTHDNDNQGAHGSHVAGIAAANRFIPTDDGFADALETVGVAGTAPDAQILTMKVFGKAVGPYDSDYFAAMEDAIWLGADAVNLSLGTAAPGTSYNDTYADLLAYLETTDTVVVMSGGNSGYWAQRSAPGNLYADDVNFATGGAPGSYDSVLAVGAVDNGTNAISDFSSWGVPGDLGLKPELVAPGGSILSVDGEDADGYTTMSGTSMAAPQVAGMAALLAQYIRAEGLAEGGTGLSVRHLAQSLLMSTARPLRDDDGNYYALMQQGAGLARADLAAGAETYILVEGTEDGKVKAELGEDPARTGTYSFTFSIRDLRGKDAAYTLSADLFTQEVLLGKYLGTGTTALSGTAIFEVNGETLETGANSRGPDLNGDGVTNESDADFLLEYLLGNENQLAVDGDIDGDGEISTYDAHLLLARLDDGVRVEVPAYGSVTVKVTLTLSDSARAMLEEHYPSGAYVEAFVRAEGDNTVHSIPVLGFYGSWTEPGMYDVGTYPELTAGTESRTPYLYRYNGYEGNCLTVSDGTEYFFGGNPVVAEAEYLPRRNAFNNENGMVLAHLYFALIRHAADARLQAANADTGEVYLSKSLGELEGAYYHTNLGVWQNVQQSVALNWDAAGLAEGTVVDVSLIAAPELYRVYDAQTGSYTADWSRVEAGGYLTTRFTIDNTAPEAQEIALDSENTKLLNVTARDNQYVAAAVVMNSAGTSVLSTVPANQTEPDSAVTLSLDLSDVIGSEFLVAVYDYAGNAAAYAVTLELDTQRPYFTAFDRTNTRYIGMEADGNTLPLAATDRGNVRAAEYVGGYIYEVTDDNKLYVVQDGDLSSFRYVGELDPDEEIPLGKVNDMAFNPVDGKLYCVFNNSSNYPRLGTIDLATGRMTDLGLTPCGAATLAIDGQGNFYSVGESRSELKIYTADVVDTWDYTQPGTIGNYSTSDVTSMAWDHNTDSLYWACTDGDKTYMLRVDPATAEPEYLCYYDFAAAGLYIPGGQGDGLVSLTDEVSHIDMETEATMIPGDTVQLTAWVRPWNVSDADVVWSSADESVATVDQNGLVTGVGVGKTTITAASVLNPDVTAVCQVNVALVHKELKSLLWTDDGRVSWVAFDTADPADYTVQYTVEEDLPLATMVIDNSGAHFTASLDTAAGTSTLYTKYKDGFGINFLGDSDVPYTDMAYAPNVGCILATSNGNIVMVDSMFGGNLQTFDWMEGAGDLVGITYYGSEYIIDYEAYADFFLLLDSQGNVYREVFVETEDGVEFFYGPKIGYLRNIGQAVDIPWFQSFHYDGEYVYWARNDGTNPVELLAWDWKGSGNVSSLGTFPADVDLVGGLYIYKSPYDDLSADGSLNALETTSYGNVTVNIPLPADAANGTVTVSYDPAALTFVSAGSAATAFAFAGGAGTLELAFAERSALAAGAEIAALTFTAETRGTTALTVTTGELNDGKADHTQTISLTLGSVVASGTSGDTAWTLYSDGQMVISGNGAMENYETKTAMPWHPYRNYIKSVVIESGVTAIGSYAFYGLTALKTIDIPATVTNIGAYAFKNSTALDGVVLPDGLTQLGESAFYGCAALTAIDIPASLWTVRPYTFKNCTALESVTFHEGNLMKISDAAFYNTALTAVALPDCMDILDVFVFKNCKNLASVTLGSGLTEIREAAFYATAISELQVPAGITLVGPYAFKNCVDLAAVSLPQTLETIGESAFFGCTGLTALEIPAGVTKIGGYAFKRCTALADVSLPDSLETIGDSAFHSCTALTAMAIPGGVNTIGEYCFSASGLREITFTGDAPAFGTGVFNKVTASAFYPSANATWTESIRRSYGGTITWIAT